MHFIVGTNTIFHKYHVPFFMYIYICIYIYMYVYIYMYIYTHVEVYYYSISQVQHPHLLFIPCRSAGFAEERC